MYLTSIITIPSRSFTMSHFHDFSFKNVLKEFSKNCQTGAAFYGLLFFLCVEFYFILFIIVLFLKTFILIYILCKEVMTRYIGKIFKGSLIWIKKGINWGCNLLKGAVFLVNLEKKKGTRILMKGKSYRFEIYLIFIE